MALLPVEEAQARLLAAHRPLTRTERLPLIAARNRTLAADVVATLTQPPFDASAMDGYALRAGDATQSGVRLTVIGQSAAGHGFAGTVGPGEAVRIFTGAPVPAGADAVLIQEDAEPLEEGRAIRTRVSVPIGRHIRPRGQDFARGDQVLVAGDRLDGARLMLAAAANCATVEVFARPRVGLLATGDELVPAGTTPGANQIIASNTPALAAMAQDLGADVVDFGIVADDRQAIAAAVRRAKDEELDVLVTTGGVSVGDHDLVQAALTDLGLVLDFWKIAMRPGKPLMVGRLDTMPVLGLPGNPVSSMVCALLFLEPLLCHLGHLTRPRRLATAVTVTDIPANDHRQDYLRARLLGTGQDLLRVERFLRQDSSLTRVYAAADALILRPPHTPALSAGSTCQILKLRQDASSSV